MNFGICDYPTFLMVMRTSSFFQHFQDLSVYWIHLFLNWHKDQIDKKIVKHDVRRGSGFWAISTSACSWTKLLEISWTSPKFYTLILSVYDQYYYWS